MARSTAKEETVTEAVAEVTPDQTTVPEWVTRSAEESAVELYRAPVTQWRRKLEGHELIKWLADAINSYEEDDPRMALEMAAQIAQGGTAGEVLGGGETTKGHEVYDVLLAIEHISFTVSQHEKGCPYFAVVHGKRTDTGEATVFSLGGWRATLQLAQLHYLAASLPADSPYLVPEGTEGAFAPETYPFYFKLKQSEQTSRGFRVNYLAPPTA